MEGYIDTIMMYKYGFENTVASMGTSVSKPQLFIILKKTKNHLLCKWFFNLNKSIFYY